MQEQPNQFEGQAQYPAATSANRLRRFVAVLRQKWWVLLITTSLGAEGLQVIDGKHLLIADDAAGIADACASLLSDHALRTALVDAAVEVAIAHARPRIVSQLAQTLSELGGFRHEGEALGGRRGAQ